jgi:hypothetical protein
MATRFIGKGEYDTMYFNTLDVLNGKMPFRMDEFTYRVPATCSREKVHCINLAALTGHKNKQQVFKPEFISAVAKGMNEGYLKKGNTLSAGIIVA